MKKPFLTLAQAREIVKTFPTPFHIYDERGIRENARALRAAFAWNPGFKEYFAVKATPTPGILKILREEGCGVDCSSLTELMLSERCGFFGTEIVFSSNETPAEEFQLADKLGAYINLDDLTHVDFLHKALGRVPRWVCCRFNPGGVFTLGKSEEGFQVMDEPGQAKYGMTRPQLAQAFTRLRELGAEHFGIHAFLASNTISNEYYPALACGIPTVLRDIPVYEGWLEHGRQVYKAKDLEEIQRAVAGLLDGTLPDLRAAGRETAVSRSLEAVGARLCGIYQREGILRRGTRGALARPAAGGGILP